MTEEEFLGRPIEAKTTWQEDMRKDIEQRYDSLKASVITKDTNPKDAVGIRKAPMSAVPAQPLLELGLAMMEGARKYGRHNYRIAGVRASVYYDAALRHLMAWWEGEDVDPDSGLSHLAKAMACLCVIRDSMLVGNWTDDRPPAMDAGWQVPLNKKAGDLIDRLPIAKEPYTHKQLLSGSITFTDPVQVALIDCSTACPTVTSAQFALPLDYQNWLQAEQATAVERAS